MRKPIWVYVHWSESNLLQSKELLTFNEFECKCKQVVRDVGIDNGYDKTKIKVLFDDGDYYETRLDLCPQDHSGFRSYCDTMIKWIGSERFNKTYNHDPEIAEEYMTLRKYLLDIDWV